MVQNKVVVRRNQVRSVSDAATVRESAGSVHVAPKPVVVQPGDRYRSELNGELMREAKDGHHTEQPLYKAYLELGIKVEQRAAGSYVKGK